MVTLNKPCAIWEQPTFVVIIGVDGDAEIGIATNELQDDINNRVFCGGFTTC